MDARLVCLAIVAAALAGCREPGESAGPACEQPPAIAVGLGVADFRERIARQVAASPPETPLRASLTFHDGVTAADGARIAEHGGEIVYRFQTLPALVVEFSPAALGAYVAADAGRLEDASLGLIVCNQAAPEVGAVGGVRAGG